MQTRTAQAVEARTSLATAAPDREAPPQGAVAASIRTAGIRHIDANAPGRSIRSAVRF